MEIHKFILEEMDEENLTIGLIQLLEEFPYFEFLYKINQSNSFLFKRIDDVVSYGHYYDYYFPVFEYYDTASNMSYKMIANKSIGSKQKKEIAELFIEEKNNSYLLKNKKEIDYILTTSDIIADFSLISLPENLAIMVEEYPLSSQEDLYQLIQYYE